MLNRASPPLIGFYLNKQAQIIKPGHASLSFGGDQNPSILIVIDVFIPSIQKLSWSDHLYP